MCDTIYSNGLQIESHKRSGARDDSREHAPQVCVCCRHLLDLYAAHLPFSHAYLLEPDRCDHPSSPPFAHPLSPSLLEPDSASMDAPRDYRNRTEIRVLRRFIEVGTRRIDTATDAVAGFPHFSLCSGF